MALFIKHVPSKEFSHMVLLFQRSELNNCWYRISHVRDHGLQGQAGFRQWCAFTLISYCAFSLACDDHQRKYYCLWKCSNNFSEYFGSTMIFFIKLKCIIKKCNHIILYDPASIFLNNNGWNNCVLKMEPLSYCKFNDIYSSKIQLSSHQNFNKNCFLCQKKFYCQRYFLFTD